jgi:threonine synthase
MGLTADPTRLRFVQIGIDAVDVPTVREFWRAVLGYANDPRPQASDIFDPRRLTMPIIFQQMPESAEARLAQRNRTHVDVYVPDDASPSVITRLKTLGANVTRCAREPGVAGDPAYLRFRDAVARGALPFTCQGNENGLVIEGGQTLGWELASQLAARSMALDHLFIQAGGGALASATIAALEEAEALGVLPRMPRIHAVQTLASPLRRAYDRVLERGIDEAVAHRSQFMWPWETAPHSIATGILDDETYDWAAVLRGVLATGGSVITVSEDALREANGIAGDGVSATGSAGLAGALSMRRADESVGVLFTGANVPG